MNKTICEIRLERSEKTKLYIRVAKEVEEIIKNACQAEPKESRAWGTKFYEHKSEASTLKSKFTDGKYNSYGDNLMYGNVANISVLRTVGVSNGVTIELKQLYPDAMLTSYAEQVRGFVKDLYTQFLRKVVVKASLSLEEI